MTRAHQEWLAQHTEEAREPDRLLCDPHHHLWRRPDSSYLLEDLRGDTGSGHRVGSTVFVECMASYRSDGPEEERPLGETEFVAEIALASERSSGAVIRGIVGFADLTLGDAVRPVLEQHQRLAGGRFRGIRHAAAWDASPEVKNSHTDPPRALYRLPQFRRGVALLGDLDLVCDAWQYHTQLAGEEGLEGLARAVPQTTFVLNHCGGPVGVGPYAATRTGADFDLWRRGIDAVAACPNVVVKLGGILMPRNGFDFHLRPRPPGSEEIATAIKPWIEHCMAAFGVDRCMFESNFPVDKLSCSYVVLWNAFKRLVAGESEAVQDRLLCGNAERVYRIR